jgi:hypothetical protein
MLTLAVLTTSGKLQQRVVLDGKLGHAYNPSVLDLNGDGHLHIVVGNHESDPANTAVYAYSIPANILNPRQYQRRVLASNFPVVRGFTNMAPGFVTPVWPRPQEASHSQAWLLVAGDGDHCAHLLVPSAPYQFRDQVIKN